MMTVNFEGWEDPNKRRCSKARESPCVVDRMDPFAGSHLGLNHDSISNYRPTNPTSVSCEREVVMVPKGQWTFPKGSVPCQDHYPELLFAAGTGSIRKCPRTKDLFQLKDLLTKGRKM